MRAAADLHDVGVAECDRDLLERKPEQVRRHLRETRLVTLPRRLGSDDDLDSLQDGRWIGALLGRTGRGFDVVGEAAAEQLAAAARILVARSAKPAKSAGASAGPCCSHTRRCRRSSRSRSNRASASGRNEIAAAQIEAIEAELARGLVDQTFDRKRDLRPTRAAIGLRAHRVGVDRPRVQRGVRDVVSAGDQAGALAQRRQRHAARADIADIGRAHGEEFPRRVDRQPTLVTRSRP